VARRHRTSGASARSEPIGSRSCRPFDRSGPMLAAPTTHEVVDGWSAIITEACLDIRTAPVSTSAPCSASTSSSRRRASSSPKPRPAAVRSPTLTPLPRRRWHHRRQRLVREPRRVHVMHRLLQTRGRDPRRRARPRLPSTTRSTRPSPRPHVLRPTLPRRIRRHLEDVTLAHHSVAVGADRGRIRCPNDPTAYDSRRRHETPAAGQDVTEVPSR
jgi:hypothetical protein